MEGKSCPCHQEPQDDAFCLEVLYVLLLRVLMSEIGVGASLGIGGGGTIRTRPVSPP